jgi:hypothetical protein
LGEDHTVRLFEKLVSRKLFGTNRVEDGTWREFNNDELHNIYSPPNIVRVIISRGMR